GWQKGQSTLVSSRYTTTAVNDPDWGILQAQTTTGGNFVHGNQNGCYTTTATIDLSWGVVLSTTTIGEGWQKGDRTLVSSRYTTTAQNDPDWGILQAQTTVGGNFVHNIQNGCYTTTSTIDQSWGSVQSTTTIGEGWQKGVPTLVSSRYTTAAKNDDTWGILEAQTTYGASFVPGGQTGCYTTTSDVDHSWGIVLGTETLGKSWLRLDPTKVTGRYTTRATNDSTWGILSSQTTWGISLSHDAITGKYTTTSTIDRTWGIVLGSATNGESGRGYGTGTVYVTAMYETISTNDETWGILQAQTTGGTSFNSVGVTGRYTTTLDAINRFWGIIEKTKTVGISLKRDKMVGQYTTVSSNDITWGIQKNSHTDGNSLRYLENDPTSCKIMGMYSTDAEYDNFGVQVYSQTRGISNTIGHNTGYEELAGKYTTTSYASDFDEYGLSKHSYTEGISYKMNGQKIAGEYSTNSYFTFGVQTSSTTTGVSYRQSNGVRGTIAGSYTTESRSDVTYGVAIYSRTIGQSYDMQHYLVGIYTTISGFYAPYGNELPADVAFLDTNLNGVPDIVFDYDPWGDMQASLTLGYSEKDGIKTGSYSTATLYEDGYTTRSLTSGRSEKNGWMTGEYVTDSAFDYWGNTSATTTVGESCKEYMIGGVRQADVKGVYTTFTNTFDDWGDQTMSVTRGVSRNYGIDLETYESVNTYHNGLTVKTTQHGDRNTGVVADYTTETFYDASWGYIVSSTTTNRMINATSYADKTYSVETYYKAHLADDGTVASPHYDDRLIDFTITENNDEDRYNGGPEYVRAVYSYTTFTYGSYSTLAMSKITQNDFKHTATYYRQNQLITYDDQDRIIDYIEADSSRQDLAQGGPGRVKTNYWYAIVDIDANGPRSDMVEVIDYTSANDSRNSFTYFMKPAEMKLAGLTNIYFEENIIKETVQDNELDDMRRGGSERINTRYTWGTAVNTYDAGTNSREVAVMKETRVINDSKKTHTVYLDDPSVLDDPTKRDIWYIETNVSLREQQSGLYTTTTKSVYQWETVQPVRNEVQKKFRVIKMIKTIDGDASDVDIRDGLDTIPPLSITVYRQDPYSGYPEDRVIDYTQTFDNSTHEAGNYTIYFYRPETRVLPQMTITKACTSYTETCDIAELGQETLKGRLRARTYYILDPMYDDPLYAGTIKPMDRVVVDFTESFKRDGELRSVQHYYYDSARAISALYTTQTISDLNYLGYPIDQDNDSNPTLDPTDTLLVKKGKVWNAFDLDCVIRYYVDDLYKLLAGIDAEHMTQAEFLNAAQTLAADHNLSTEFNTLLALVNFSGAYTSDGLRARELVLRTQSKSQTALAGLTLYWGDKGDELVMHEITYKRAPVGGKSMLDSINNYLYNWPGTPNYILYTTAPTEDPGATKYMIDQVRGNKIYYEQVSGLPESRLRSIMEYSGYAGKERVDSALNYMRDATTVYSQTYYDYWDDGRLQQITEAVNMETSNPNSTH
ncbi:MAG: hypothetical protein PHT32_06805, partial [Candidatus Omnitrophica bacterium]|nr:hypothetical protein [Candidatus Omnitrophota bacterium]